MYLWGFLPSWPVNFERVGWNSFPCPLSLNFLGQFGYSSTDTSISIIRLQESLATCEPGAFTMNNSVCKT